MSSIKIVLLLLFFASVSNCFDAHNFIKKIHQKELSPDFASKAFETLQRKRRDVAETNAIDTSDESTEELMQLAKFFMEIAWQEDKLDVLSGFLEEMTDSETNLTVIGWQRILDGQGNVKEINTAQLVIPPKPGSDDGNIVEKDDDDDDEDDDDRALPHSTIKEMKEMFEPMYQLGIPASVTFEEYDKEGKAKRLIYMDKDELFYKEDNFSIYNKTSVVPQQELDNFIKSLKPTILGEPSILKYDVDGNLLVDKSKIQPHLLGNVLDNYEAPDKILLSGPQIIAKISQQYPQEEIPKQLALYYNKNYPEYRWRVLVDPDNYYITRDVAITLSYDNFDLDENSYISYLLYGVKKPVKQ